ncbi:iron chaperone [Nocardiopsis composta]|uniref:Uncharacterized protein YdhG (YjbR/CyaY superfamily) n=1 Tax=Nocardiopsis composta TaxID=157465 RepID=A0A7W8QL72_9ACTN|nr:DUF1801 domain-containing protein [Nocardiopsis composta]MBB5432496.1 uncharacterized protein YdhG (YjbR/CyaY superfamily) [Nocardiopsis composta]
MDGAVQAYIDAVPARHRPLFDRLHRPVLETHPGAEVALSYGMPTYAVGGRRLHIGVWQKGVSLYGWDRERAAGFTARHPDLLTGKGTVRLRPEDAADVTDSDLRELIGAALDA